MTDTPHSGGFELHPTLAADTVRVADLGLSRLLLMNDRRFAWTILVPRIAGLRELHDLGTADADRLTAEIRAVSRLLLARERADKMNVAALGNMVPQLHAHVIARFATDPAWPGPVWGKVPPRPYAAGEAEKLIVSLRPLLGV